MDDRFNTIAGWVLFAGIVALASSIVAGEYFHSERPEKMGYPIAGVQEESAGGAAAEQPIEVYLATADAAKGEQTFNKCMACHNADKGGANQMGPNLWGVLGAPIGEGRGFAFSDALSKKGGSWNWDNLSQWLTSPKAFAPGTKMTSQVSVIHRTAPTSSRSSTRTAIRHCRFQRRRRLPLLQPAPRRERAPTTDLKKRPRSRW